MSKVERRFIPFDSSDLDFEERNDDSPAKITGYAAVFYVEGDEGTEYELMPGLVERVMPRAFNRVLEDKAAQNPAALFNHDPNMILGRVNAKTLKLSKDTRGLKYEIVPPNSTVGKNVMESVRRKDVTGSSYSFVVDEAGQKFKRDKRADGTEVDVRELHSVSVLYDVGPVVYPAFTGTSAGMRAANSDLSEVRSAYEAWKQEQNGEAEARAKAEREAQEAQDALNAKLAAIQQRAALVKE